MDTLFSFTLFLITLVLYFHVIYYNKINDEKLILLDYNDYNQQYRNFLLKITLIGETRAPCLCANIVVDPTNNYSFILNELKNLTAHVPCDIGKENVSAYISLKLSELEHNIVNVNNEAFELNIAKLQNTIGLATSQTTLLTTLNERINTLAETYLSKQKILYKSSFIYFSNNSLKSYIPFQYYKSAVNIFHIVEGKCNVLIANWNDVEKDAVISNYGCFRFHTKNNVFDANHDESVKILKLQDPVKHSIPLDKGDVLIVPNNWFVGFELIDKCIVLREETTTLVSCITAIPDYMKYFFYRSTKVIENKISDEADMMEKRMDVLDHDADTICDETRVQTPLE